MSLQVWLPLTGHLNNQGLSNVTVTNNGATVDNSGKIGKCYYFNGSSQIKISLPTSMTTIKNTTVAAWIKSTGTVVALGGIGYDSSTYNYSGAVTLYTSGWQFPKSNGYGYIAGGTIANTQVWHHVCCTVETDLITTYLDGVQIATGSLTTLGSTTSLDASKNFIEIGQDSPGGDERLTGYVNDVRIYDHALSAKEVKELSKGLVLHYPLSDPYIENTTNLVVDLKSGNRTTLSADKLSVTTNGTSGDTYFWFNTNEALTQNTQYTLSCRASGISEGSYWVFRINNAAAYPTTVRNGYNTFTFTAGSDLDGKTQILVDDTNQPDYQNPLTLSHFQLEKKNHATPYTRTSRTNEMIYDTSGNKYNGSQLGTFTISDDTARYNISTTFNGTDNGILIENLSLSNAINTAVTYAFWIKPNSENGARSVYFGSYTGNSWSVEKRTDNLLRLYWNGSPDEVCSGVTITDNVWQHVCITKSGINDIKVYLNGVQKWTSTATHNALTFPTTYRIGRDTRSGDNTPYKGLMSDFRIYATALSEEDVKELYNTAASLSNNGTLFAYEYVEV